MIEIVEGDITRLAVDAIVNAANTALRGGGGVDGAIHRAAGPALLTELQQYPGCATGDAVLTAGYALPARYVIHAVGPVWQGGNRGEADLLRRAYDRSFALATAVGDGSGDDPRPVRSIAFPAISTGVYGYPKRAAAEIALASMRAHEGEFDRVVACIYDAESRRMYEDVLATIAPG